MAKRVQRRRGTTSEHANFTGAEGEVTVDTTLDILVVHDGTTAGGHPVAKADGSNIANNSIGIVQLNVADGSAGWFLQTNGSGTLSFAAVDVGGTSLGGSKLGGTIANATIDEDAVGVYEINVDEGQPNQFLKTDGVGGLSFATVVTDPAEKPLHEIYEKEDCFSPIPSLALHCTNINSIYGLSPNIDWKRIWEENKL